MVQQDIVANGSWAARTTGAGVPSTVTRILPATYPELHLRIGFHLVSRSTATWFASWRNPTGKAIAFVGLTGAGKLAVRSGPTSQQITSGVIPSAGAWHTLELRTLVSGAAGQVEVWLDGAAVPQLSATLDVGTEPIARLMVGDPWPARTFDVAYDDVTVATGPVGSETGEPPTVPTGLAASVAGPTQVDLDWEASVDESGVAGYSVYRSIDGAVFQEIGTTPSSSYRDLTVVPDTEYWYAVDAFDGAGNRSAMSDPVPVTTDPVGSTGSWTQPFDVGVSAVHATVLHTGEVLLFNRSSGSVGTVAKLLDPTSGAVVDVTYAAPHNLFCAGHSVTPSGQVFVTGGTKWGSGAPNGTKQTAVFDPVTRTWRAGPSMGQERWYPSNLQMPDGTTLIFSGKISKTVWATTVERYDPATEAMSTLPSSANLKMSLYPRIFQVGDGRIVRVGQEGRTKFFDRVAARWTDGPKMIFPGRSSGSAVLLPGLREVFTMGGSSNKVATATSEILDLGSGSPSWRATASMAHPRINFNAVTLPDETVLVVGGNTVDLYDNPVLEPELYDPRRNTWTPLATQGAPRAYHSTAVLLPDGRVLSAGQTFGGLSNTAEIYSPPYLFAGPRPVITGAPEGVGYGGSFSVDTPQAGEIASVALIRPGSPTHGIDPEQRYVRLDFVAGAGGLTVDAPASAVHAPPGWYMLFLIDASGVPSVATWVQLG